MTIKLKIKKGDKVSILTGKDKGKTGEVLRVFPEDRKVIVSTINVVKKHQKPSRVSAGGIISKEMPIHISNVAIIDPKTNNPSRVGYKFLENGDKVRFAKKSGEVI